MQGKQIKNRNVFLYRNPTRVGNGSHKLANHLLSHRSLFCLPPGHTAVTHFSEVSPHLASQTAAPSANVPYCNCRTPPLAADPAVLPGGQPPLTVPSPELGLDTGALADQDGEVGICLLQGHIVLLNEVSGEGRGNDGSPWPSPLGPGKLRAGRYLTLPTHRVRPRSSCPAPTHLTPRLPGER